MANIYDRIIKEIIEPVLKPLASIALDLRFENTIEIKDKIQYTLEREGDHLKMLLLEDRKMHKLLHLEFHGKDQDLGKVMLLKKSMLVMKFDLPVIQFVIYIGNNKTLRHLKPFYKDKQTIHHFEVIILKKFSYRKFVDSNIPEAVILGILADFEGKEPSTVIKEILQKIKELSADKIAEGQHFRRLEVLSKLRKLQA